MIEPNEKQIVGSLVQFFANEGYRVRLEVPNMGQSADLVATRSRWVTFVEAKRRDWRRALQQCRAHETVADYICLAVFSRASSDTLIAQVSQYGYGLIKCDAESMACQWVIEPRRNTQVWPPQRRRVAAAMKGIAYAD